MTRRKEVKDEIEWDKKKIIIFSIVVFALLFAAVWFKARYLDTNVISVNKLSTDAVKGVSTQNLPSFDIKKNIQTQIDSLKNQAENINVVEVATSSPQVQKIINDLKGLKDLPKSELKKSCEKICSGL